MNLKKLLLTSVALSTLTPMAFANQFPVTFDTIYGSVTIEKEPQRVVTLDYAGVDDLLALGVQPLAFRAWFKGSPRGVWPWASKLLKGNPPAIGTPLSIEQVAAQKPDVIIALWSNITEDEFKKLSTIAPVVATPKGFTKFALPWDQRAILTGRAVGKEELAKEKVAAIKDQFAQVRKEHPNWQGKTATVAYLWGGVIGAYGPKDIRLKVMNEFGFRNNLKVAELIPPSRNNLHLSVEQIKVLDSDLILWGHSPKDDLDTLTARKFLKANKEGHEVIVDLVTAVAFSHTSLLSLPYVINSLVPKIEKALDKK